MTDNQPGASSAGQKVTGMDMEEHTEAASHPSRKRNRNVNPDTGEEVVDAKRPRMQLDSDKKIKCLKTIVDGYAVFLGCYFSTSMELFKEANHEVLVSAQIANIIFTIHTLNRQLAAGKTHTNVIEKSGSTDFTITFRAKTYSKKRDELSKLWIETAAKNGLVYKKFGDKDEDNWYGTMGPCLDFSVGFGLRLKELRIGHSRMPCGKAGETLNEFRVSRYGRNGAHHVLLEGCTFPPEKRSSMAQNVGPMTAFLSMLKSEGMYRRKWEAAVKRAFNHIPLIDDIIEVTKTHKRTSDVADMITLLAEIAMITTTRQATRMFFPLNLLYNVSRKYSANADDFWKFFNTSGAAGFFTYKHGTSHNYTLGSNCSAETAAQIIFHYYNTSFT